MAFARQVIHLIKQIPAGRVATYGQIAALAGSPRAALMVGQILRRSSESDHLPWQRVISSTGCITIVNIQYPAELQAKLLEAEGVKVSWVNKSFKVDLGEYLWQPIDASRAKGTL